MVAILGIDSMPPLLLLWPGCVEVMVVAILWFIGCIELVGLVLVVVAIFVWYMLPLSYQFMALVYQLLASIVLKKNSIYIYNIPGAQDTL